MTRFWTFLNACLNSRVPKTREFRTLEWRRRNRTRVRRCIDERIYVRSLCLISPRLLPQAGSRAASRRSISVPARRR